MTQISPIGLASEVLNRASPKLRPFEHGAASDFSTQMRQAVGEVSKLQSDADGAMKAFESGDEVDVTKVMMAREKASIAFEATLQIRNKLLSAYKDITSMPV